MGGGESYFAAVGCLTSPQERLTPYTHLTLERLTPYTGASDTLHWSV